VSLTTLHEWRRQETLIASSVYIPFWVREASKRAYSLLHLFLAMDDQPWAVCEPSISAQLDTALAMSLVKIYRSLDCIDNTSPVSCQRAIVEVATSLADFFAPTIGTLLIESDVIKLALPAEMRRALVLSANEMVTNVIQHAFLQRSSGQIFVGLAPNGDLSISLRVESDGTKFDYSHSSYSMSIVCGLAQLLNGKLIISESALGGSTFELEFPAPSRRHL
jgi:two-component sensor histidine kinase